MLRFCACLIGGVAVAAVRLSAQTPGSVAPVYGKAAENKIYAQELIYQVVRANPDLGDAGLHALPPGGTEYTIVAQTLDLIGKKSSPANVELIKRDQIEIHPFVINGTPRWTVSIPLRQRDGAIIGMAALSFYRRPGVTALTVHARAEIIMAELAQKIPEQAALFKPSS